MTTYTYELSTAPAARGAQGSIYFGRRSDGLEVAVKVAAPGERAQDALQREIELLQAMSVVGTPGVVVCLDAIQLDGRVAMVMPRYQGNLGDWLQAMLANPQAHTLVEVLEHCATLARTLHRVHEVQHNGQRIVHRDVKPENIFVDYEGGLHLGDFGGAMAIDGLQHVELALFGTPMWAPLDQILPGVTIPDTTWDTYALCVLLYACFTGARPAYQADPRVLLTEQGRQLWALAREAILAEGEPRRTLRRDFARERQKSRAADLVDFTGHAALNEADRAALVTGVQRLGALAGVTEGQVHRLQRGLWTLLVRGLSPLSHPSPPNRFRDGNELADALEDLRRIAVEPDAELGTRAPAAPLVAAPHPTPAPAPRLADPMAGPMSGPDVPITLSAEGTDAPASTLPVGRAGAIAGALVLAALAAVVLWIFWTVFFGGMWAATMVTIPAGADGPSFLLDRTEVTASGWRRCVSAGVCATQTTSNGSEPAVGVPFAEAKDYCKFRGGRLPTVDEWLRVAGSKAWPWGDAEPTCAHVIAADCGLPPQPAGAAPDGVTPDGVLDLAGNVWEWAIDAKQRGVLMGGSARSPRSQIGRNGRWPIDSATTPELAGLRCAYDPEP